MGRNSLQICIVEVNKWKTTRPEVHNLQKLLYVAGERLDDPTIPAIDVHTNAVKHVKIPEYFEELKQILEMKHICRQAVRKHVIDANPHENLFRRIPKLGLPSIVTEYLLYDCSMDSCATDSKVDSDLSDEDTNYRIPKRVR